jgi:hypothetical protein
MNLTADAEYAFQKYNKTLSTLLCAPAADVKYEFDEYDETLPSPKSRRICVHTKEHQTKRIVTDTLHVLDRRQTAILAALGEIQIYDNRVTVIGHPLQLPARIHHL